MDTLIQIDLDVVLKNKRHLYDEEIWDHMNEKACGQIRSCLTKEVKYLVKDEECAMTLWRTLEEKYLLKSPENLLHAISQVYGFRMKPVVSIHDHVSRFEKLLADLKNLDEDIKDEVNAMILLYSLPEEYSHFVTTLIYGKSVIIFKDVCTTLTNLEIRNNDKILNEHRLKLWKDCPKAQKRNEKKPAAANMARKDEDSDYSLSITPAAYVASSSEWILDTGATYHLKLKKVRFVPALKKNLISVGALEAKGYKVTIEDGIMKFTHGAMVILRVWVHTMRAKDEVLEIFVKWKKLVDTQTGGNIKVLRYDNGGEYTSDPFLQVCQNEGIKRHFRVRHTPQQNGVAERMNRTLLEKVRWCLAYYHVKEGKLDPRARKAIFVGFKGGVKGFKLWDFEDKKFVCSRDVTFDEASMMKASSSQQAENKTTEILQRVEFDATPYVPVSSTLENGLTMEVTPRVEEEVVSSDIPQNEETINDVDNDDFIATRKPTLHSSENDQWKLVMEEEMKSLNQNQTWELVKLPKRKRAISNKWVYTKKQGSPNQSTPRYKARLVAKDFAQNEGIDYNEVFSPVVKYTSIRILLALVAEYELELTQLDVITAFLHEDLEEEIYMIQPCGFRVAGKENHVCKLIKSLYGLKQSLRQWYKRFDQFIQGQKFTRSEHDHCVYFRRLLDRAFIYLLFYVDDMLIASKNRDEIERLKKQLASKFEMKELGDAQRILGMKIRRDKKNESVWLTQKSYLKKVLERFGMDDKTKPVCTHLAPHFKLSSSSCPRSQEQRDYMVRVPYASVVGSLMYAMVCTRSDISQAMSMVSRYMHNPGKNQWLAVKWILRYLYGTIDIGLLFKKDCGQQCVGYCDSDFAGDLNKRRSTTGYVFTLGGGPVSRRSILQSTIALSTTEVGYMAATESVKEAIWLKDLLGDL
ncbi:hypothetical protein KPL71_004622 [Citrus sinensis]|uniref:Uncharacterized protein n=1 Tax=Citrus sinensis TaxID=2711 RepID=A0ACB8N745_CITSI|nr:hypothetical protein KPL71_004622 [Citrus sinensis]